MSGTAGESGKGEPRYYEIVVARMRWSEEKSKIEYWKILNKRKRENLNCVGAVWANMLSPCSGPEPIQVCIVLSVYGIGKELPDRTTGSVSVLFAELYSMNSVTLNFTRIG